MKDLVNLNKRSKNITGEFYRKIALPIVHNSNGKYDVNIILTDNSKHTGRVVEILEDEHSLAPDAYVILKFKFKTSSSEMVIDLFDVHRIL